MKVRRAVVLLSLVAGAQTSVAAAALAPLLSLAPSTGTTALDFKAGKATVHLVIRNDSDRGGPVAAHFITGGTSTQVKRAKASEKEALEIQLLAPLAPVAARDQVLVSLLFTRRASATDPLSGELVLRLAGAKPVGPLVITLAPTPPTANPPAKKIKRRFAESKATIATTRVLGPLTTLLNAPGLEGWKGKRLTSWMRCDRGCLWGEKLPITTRGEAPERAATLLNGSSGGSARVTLTGTGPRTSNVAATNIRRAGTYEGSLTLDPDAKKPRALALTIKARDFILWPFLALMSGVLLAALWLRPWAVKRQRGVIQNSLKEAVCPYCVALEKFKKSGAGRPRRFNLAHRVPADGPYFPEGDGCKEPGSLDDVPRIYCLAAKLDSADEAENLAEEASTIIAEFERWRAIDRAAGYLWDEIKPLEKASLLRIDAEYVLNQAEQPPANDAQAAELVALLHAELALVFIYPPVSKRFRELTDEWRNKLAKFDPDQKLEELQATSTRTAASVREADLFFRQLYVALEVPQSIPHESTASDQIAIRHAFAPPDRERLEEIIGSHGAAVVRKAARERGSGVSSDRRTPQQIRTQLRRVDWLVFGATGALTALGYIATQYKEDWGSFDDYLIAFAAGAVVPAVVNWAIAPWALPYRLSKKKVKTPDPPDPAEEAAADVAT